MSSRYLPSTDADVAQLLSAIGVSGIDELFSGIPSDYRLNQDLALPPAQSEI